jgi:hypothetical protein
VFRGILLRLVLDQPVPQQFVHNGFSCVEGRSTSARDLGNRTSAVNQIQHAEKHAIPFRVQIGINEYAEA